MIAATETERWASNAARARHPAEPPSERQVDYYLSLARADVWTDRERACLLWWLAQHATRHTTKDQIAWLKAEVVFRGAA